ncbi:MAG: heavy-metal-associated domain-containing protein [Flavobacteriales bacterium]|nr:heavy-metal-associated domain-containing protein [Flavobacteriales bacterium]
MNNSIKSIIILLFASSSSLLFGQKAIETSFSVSGVCQMCEKRIEGAVDVKGVKTADYDLNSQTLTLVYNPKHISEDKIHLLLNEVGHDTEKSKATDEQYNSVHQCCKYREDEDR